MREQKRGKAIAMTPEEVDAYLAAERTCRVATVGADGEPHVKPLWFVWIDGVLWLNSVVKSQRWTDLVRSPKVAAVVDGGHDFMELHGVEIIGTAEVVGEAPRTELAPEGDSARPAEDAFGAKYAGGQFIPDGRHGWLRIVPEKITSWDFRKMNLKGA
jgi:Pyridoxamine 5'-phosphate oxidase